MSIKQHLRAVRQCQTINIYTLIEISEEGQKEKGVKTIERDNDQEFSKMNEKNQTTFPRSSENTNQDKYLHPK